MKFSVLKYVFLLTLSFLCKHLFAQVPFVGEKLPLWSTGMLDLHHINTGRGNCMIAVFPDGTTMLVDAGELSPLDTRTFTPRNAAITPNDSKKPFEWIGYYANKFIPMIHTRPLDYALITHFHDDHFGAWYPDAPLSRQGNYKLTGITGIAELIGVTKLVDRGYPSYSFPHPLKKEPGKYAGGEIAFDSTMSNYFNFIDKNMAKGMQMDSFRTGSKSQFALKFKPDDYPQFYVRNVKANQWLWNGRDSGAMNLFANDFDPDENSLSTAITINYGDFRYYTGGDNPGNVFPGDHSSRDVETKMSEVIGDVDVATMDHHGNRDAVNVNIIRNFSATVWIGQTWSADHPGHEVLIRLTNKFTNPSGAHLFSTNMLDANRHVIGPLIDRSYKSQQGHILVRVMPGGKSYYIIVLNDSEETMQVKSVFGPYYSKKKLR